MTRALESDGDRLAVQSALSTVFYNYLTDPSPRGLGARIATLRKPAPVSTATLGLGGAAVTLPPTRAFGDGTGQ